jgi:hypothetical protein
MLKVAEVTYDIHGSCTLRPKSSTDVNCERFGMASSGTLSVGCPLESAVVDQVRYLFGTRPAIQLRPHRDRNVTIPGCLRGLLPIRFFLSGGLLGG